jgi:predicted DNA-binding protein (UPF0251 family)
MRKRLIWVGAGVVAAGVLAVAGIAGVAAQTGGDAQSNPLTSFVDRLAANLGIGPDQLQSAIDKTRDQMVDDAVAQGKLTQEQGDALKQRAEGQGLKGFGRFEFKGEAAPDGQPFAKGMMGHGLLGRGLDEAASVIGIDRATLVQELQSGKTLAQVAQDHGVSRDQLKQGLLDKVGQSLDQLLDQQLQFNFTRPGQQAPSATPSVTPSSTPGT